MYRLFFTQKSYDNEFVLGGQRRVEDSRVQYLAIVDLFYCYFVLSVQYNKQWQNEDWRKHRRRHVCLNNYIMVE